MDTNGTDRVNAVTRRAFLGNCTVATSAALAWNASPCAGDVPPRDAASIPTSPQACRDEEEWFGPLPLPTAPRKATKQV